LDVTIESSDEDEGFVAQCDSMACSATGLSQVNALDALRDEIRYHPEVCPCTTVDEDLIELNVVSGL
jgi:hypothetical protein